jgi:UDP-N-acetylglucosamine--N-acetylmuramyl-(pentapeptide) pyrophosphoryl-undecaprenol N-acetylglucosamine transferase
MVPEEGFEVVLLPGRGIQRRVTLENIGALVGIARAVLTSFTLLRRTRPRVVVAMGGYASVPCSVAAFLLRIPIVVAEQNAVPGLANRITARFARSSAVSFPDTGLPREVVTGNPVRPGMLEVDRAAGRDAAHARLGIEPDRQLLVVYGGSLGALKLNEAVLASVETLADRGDLAIRHVVGSRDHPTLSERIPDLAPRGLQYQMVEFERDMPTVLEGADLVLSRAGATSVADFAALGVPSVLVPLPGAPGDHQTANARVMADADAAVLLPNEQVSGDRITELATTLLFDRRRLSSMSEAAAGLGRRDAAALVADLVEANARG